jgi:hypothetical protein
MKRKEINKKKGGTFHNNRPNRPNRPDLDGKPAISDAQSDFSTSKEMRRNTEPVNVLPEKSNAEITKELIDAIREKLSIETFILDGNTALHLTRNTSNCMSILLNFQWSGLSI